MPVNADKPHLWKVDVARSVDYYNEWFVRSAPHAYREARDETAARIETILEATANLTAITPEALRQDPTMLSTLRMMTSPPVSRDRLVGVTGASPILVYSMEHEGQVPLQTPEIDADLEKIGVFFARMADRDIFPWLDNRYNLNQVQIRRAATIVADRLCIAAADPVVRRARKEMQLTVLKQWLTLRSYSYVESGKRVGLEAMAPGTFTFGLNVPIVPARRTTRVTMPVDAAIMPAAAKPGQTPLLLDAKSAADYVKANKGRHEDAAKAEQLRNNYGADVRFVLSLCGYFDSGFLGYAAAESIDWVWEHRIDDLAQFELITPSISTSVAAATGTRLAPPPAQPALPAPPAPPPPQPGFQTTVLQGTTRS